MLAPLLSALVASAPQEPDRFAPGEVRRASLTEANVVEGDEDCVALLTFVLEVELDGPCYVDLRSLHFDAFLRVRTPEGEVVTEDDDGGVWNDARADLGHLAAGSRLLVDVGARALPYHGLGETTGPFELEAHAGPLPVPSKDEMDELVRARLQERLDTFRQTDAGGRREVHALHDLVEYSKSQREYPAMLAGAEPLVEACARVYGPSSIATAHARDDYTRALMYHRRLAEAEEWLVETVKLRDALDDPNVAVTLGNLGYVRFAQGRPGEAIEPFRRSCAIHEERGDARALAFRRRDLAECLRSSGRETEALEVLDAMLASEAPHAQFEHSILVMTGHIRLHRGEYDQAEERLAQAMSLIETAGGDAAARVETLGMMVELHGAAGDTEAALLYARDALAAAEAAFGESDLRSIGVRIQLAKILVLGHEMEEAQAIYGSLLEGGLSLPPGEEFLALYGAARMESHLAAHDAEGDAAREHARRALDFLEAAELLMQAPIARDLVANARAEALRALGDAQGALELYESMGVTPVDTIGVGRDTFLSRALTLADLGRDRDALDVVDHALRVELERAASYLFELTEDDAHEFWLGSARRLSLALSVSREMDDPAVLTRTYERAMQWKGQVGASLVRAGPDESELDAEAVDLLARLRSANNLLAQASHGGDPAALNSGAAHIEQLLEVRNELERALRDAAGRPTLEAVPLAALRAALPPRTAVVDFVLYERYVPGTGDEQGRTSMGTWGDLHVSVWIVRADRDLPIRVELGDYGPLFEAVHGVRDALAAVGAEIRGEPVSSGEPLPTRRDAYGLIWSPIAAHLNGVDTLVVSPDGVFAALPFEVLVDGDGRALLEQHRFTYLQDVESVARRDDAPRGESLLAVGGVDYGKTDGSWSALPGTLDEVRAIEARHRRALSSAERHVLVGAEASEATLVSALPGAAYVHVATHGYFEESDAEPELGRRLAGMRTGLVCAGSDDGAAHDGLLTAEELRWLDLSATRLAVLSACDTAYGHILWGEGLTSLRRALRLAGARSVVSAMWPVDDQSTARLMDAFYQNLWGDGLAPIDALHQARLSVLHRNRSEHGEDRAWSWGGFVFSGEWR